MNRLYFLACVALVFCQFLLAGDTSPVLVKKIDPNEGRSKAGVVFDAAEVKLFVDETGIPFSLESSSGLPDYVVKALAQWRYSPYRKNGRKVPFFAKLVVPVARPLTPVTERFLAPTWYPSTVEVSEALKKGRKLNEADADALEANLSNTEAPDNPRTALLFYYANQGVQNPEKARAARAKLLTWLVENDPQDDLLGSSLAIVNRSGGSLADADTNSSLTSLWLHAVAQYPDDAKVRAHALNFLQVADSRRALEILAKLPNWNGTAAWAGDVYALAALGVTTLSPTTGNAIDATSGPATIDEVASK